MRKSILLALLFCTINCALAQLNGNGYYRVQNKQTQRFVRVIDNKGSVNLATTNADLGALETVKPFERVVSDPASIIYIEKVKDGYDLKAQGTSSYNIIKYYVKLRTYSGGIYRVYAQDGSLVKYLRDENTTYDEGVVLTADGNPWDWYIKPVNQVDGQYFAFKPDVTVGGESYATIYASFPFTITSSKMKAYYISKVADGQAVYKEVVDGKVPASTAVIVKCATANYVDNKVTVENNSAAALSGNLMKGVYFKNTTNKHKNLKEYDPNTMRVLGVMSNGKLGFITANYDYLPANKAYLVVPAGSPSEIKIVSEADFKPNVKVQSVTLSQQSLTMYAGDKATLIATVLPSDATDKLVEWSSSNNNVVTVDANGAVKAVGYGKATITVTSIENSAAKATCEVQVYDHSTGVQLSATTLEMFVGDKTSLTAQTLPLSTSDGRLEWTSGNESVVKFEEESEVLAVGAGQTDITVRSVDGGHVAVCSVTVKEVSAIEDVVSTTEVSCRIYNLHGVELKTLQKGVNIVKFDDGKVKKVVIP